MDLEYPDHLHDLHNDFPFCPENAVPPTNSQNQSYTPVSKLLLRLSNKEKYVIHYRMLKTALRHGLILKRIHMVLKFNQAPWLKPYIELNTNERAKATSEFSKHLYKQMNNTIYGKSMENIRKRVELFLKNRWDGRYGIRKLIAMPNFKRRVIFNENLVAIEMKRTSIVMDKPISLGMAILDISKVVMYEYYYDFLKPKYGNNIKLTYTDTDSFILDVKTDDFYNDMKENLSRYDTSDYAIDNIYNMPRVNKKKPGVFTDELKGIAIKEYVELRSKMYSIKPMITDSNDNNNDDSNEGVIKITEIKKAKGVKSCVLKNEIEFSDYLNCLKNSTTITKTQNTFRTKLHKMYTIKQTKTMLSPFDDKRHVLVCEGCENEGCMACTFETYAHGHYKLRRPRLPFGEGPSTQEDY